MPSTIRVLREEVESVQSDRNVPVGEGELSGEIREGDAFREAMGVSDNLWEFRRGSLGVDVDVCKRHGKSLGEREG